MAWSAMLCSSIPWFAMAWYAIYAVVVWYEVTRYVMHSGGVIWRNMILCNAQCCSGLKVNMIA